MTIERYIQVELVLKDLVDYHNSFYKHQAMPDLSYGLLFVQLVPL